jgi:uncharacterized protein YcgI (DUF1989 family)
LCFDAADPTDRYNATNTIKVQRNIYIGNSTVLYSDRGAAWFTIIADTCGRHDTIYGCCSEANNLLWYGVRDTPSCYANFCEIQARFERDERSIVSNVNFFMSVPVLLDGSAAVAGGVSQPGRPLTKGSSSRREIPRPQRHEFGPADHQARYHRFAGRALLPRHREECA